MGFVNSRGIEFQEGDHFCIGSFDTVYTILKVRQSKNEWPSKSKYEFTVAYRGSEFGGWTVDAVIDRVLTKEEAMAELL